MILGPLEKVYISVSAFWIIVESWNLNSGEVIMQISLYKNCIRVRLGYLSCNTFTKAISCWASFVSD